MQKLCMVWLMLSAFVLLQGCAPEYQKESEPKCLSGLDIGTAMTASELTLVRMNFVIDKSDANLAIMTTKPLSGAQFFELWRRDNVGGYNTALASTSSIQRTVELAFTGNQLEMCVDCKVKMERLSIPEKELDSAGRSYRIFSKSDDTQQSLSLNNTQLKKMQWIDIGRDYSLEKVILERINKQITKTLAKGESTK